ncbi:hypothetical protein Krac_1913 [Ktedonobacter racemifer DSM 44963]|uniref:Uncharacterized protein n=1 Tax=Ktedonobacter racemifer DSM 44963 TaxID=485913 RepID=D6U3X4_KTERA|nr:hypothetical protein Krac_1913 [Ktedonobacter racemifer DSM 44963]
MRSPSSVAIPPLPFWICHAPIPLAMSIGYICCYPLRPIEAPDASRRDHSRFDPQLSMEAAEIQYAEIVTKCIYISILNCPQGLLQLLRDGRIAVCVRFSILCCPQGLLQHPRSAGRDQQKDTARRLRSCPPLRPAANRAACIGGPEPPMATRHDREEDAAGDTRIRAV